MFHLQVNFSIVLQRTINGIEYSGGEETLIMKTARINLSTFFVHGWVAANSSIPDLWDRVRSVSLWNGSQSQEASWKSCHVSTVYIISSKYFTCFPRLSVHMYYCICVCVHMQVSTGMCVWVYTQFFLTLICYALFGKTSSDTSRIGDISNQWHCCWTQSNWLFVSCSQSRN